MTLSYAEIRKTARILPRKFLFSLIILLPLLINFLNLLRSINPISTTINNLNDVRHTFVPAPSNSLSTSRRSVPLSPFFTTVHLLSIHPLFPLFRYHGSLSDAINSTSIIFSAPISISGANLSFRFVFKLPPPLHFVLFSYSSPNSHRSIPTHYPHPKFSPSP